MRPFRGFNLAVCFLPFFLWCAVPTGLLSQVIEVDDPPQVAPVNTLTVNDLDFLHATTPKWLFTISMRAAGTVSAIMEITVDAFLADGNNYPGAVEMMTDPFPIMNARVVTNIDLLNENPHIAQYTVRSDAKQRLEETALSGGRIPAGVYRFTVSVYPEGGQPPGTTVIFTLEPTNPSSIELLFPPDGDEDASEFPLFHWFYDGPRSRIVIYEMLPGQQSPEEAVTGTPHLTETLASNSFQYPTAGARQLQPGKSYAWLVEGLVDITGGTEASLRSEVRQFRVSQRGTGWDAGLLEEIERALGADHRGVFDRIRAEGLTLAGGMYLNGAIISHPEILQLLEYFRSNPDAVTLVELQD
jgi:hypothetical protein